FYAEAGSGIPGQPLMVRRRPPEAAAAAGQGGIPSAPVGGPPALPPRIVIEGASGPRATVVPKVEGIAHVILAVEVGGTPILTSYRRVILRIGPGTIGPSPKVALTFDDLPVHAALPAGLTRSDVARSILAALAAHHAPPTYGFVNAKALEGAPETEEVLRLWRAAGYPLGNHTYSHIDLTANTPEAFEQDVRAGEPVLKRLMEGADWHWLRFPYLHEGDTLEKRRAVRRTLADEGYRIAEVTLSFDDW